MRALRLQYETTPLPEEKENGVNFLMRTIERPRRTTEEEGVQMRQRSNLQPAPLFFGFGVMGVRQHEIIAHAYMVQVDKQSYNEQKVTIRIQNGSVAEIIYPR